MPPPPEPRPGDHTRPHGLYLTTADPANVPLYRHFGFTTLHETPLGPLTVTSMSRAGK
ncbi:hypothetical protein ACH4U5_00800 [Streptomyces sp. NPDC020858]|uniref:hypothetical protein n=1 Tax=Streptomyces sp. NPDC020858 TaxID=3365097 RepID=UPI00379435C0